MQFGSCPVEKAARTILAHSLRAGERLLKKGRLLTNTDIAALRQAGLREVIVARLDPGDVHEDEAAARIAAATAGEGACVGAAFTGRANLYADAQGIALIDEARVRALNAVDESITL